MKVLKNRNPFVLVFVHNKSKSVVHLKKKNKNLGNYFTVRWILCLMYLTRKILNSFLATKYDDIDAVLNIRVSFI